MDYAKIYVDLIEKARTEWYSDREIHHIIPKCIGGSNDSDNLIGMSFRQHYIAHLLLYKIYKKEYPNLIFAIECFYDIRRHKSIHIRYMPRWIRRAIFINRHKLNREKLIDFRQKNPLIKGDDIGV